MLLLAVKFKEECVKIMLFGIEELNSGELISDVE